MGREEGGDYWEEGVHGLKLIKGNVREMEE